MTFTPIIVIAVLALMAILLLVFLILSGRAWGYLHIAMVFLVFVAMSVTLVLLSGTFRLRNDWAFRYQENKKEVEKQTAAYEEAVFGPPNAFSLPRDSVRGIEAALQVERVRQGRIWKNVTASQGSDGQVKLTFPDTGGGNAPVLGQDMLLFAFQNGDIAVDGTNVTAPVGYVATVRVKSADAGGAVVEGLFVADPKEFSDPQVNWTLFEKMPNDTNDVFLRAFAIAEDPSSRNLQVNEYLTNIRAKLKELMPQDRVGIAGETEYESFIDKFAFDGMRMDAIKNWLGNKRSFNPDDSEEFELVEFEKAFSEQVNDTTPTSDLNNNSVFDRSTGAAVDDSLKAKDADDNGMVTLNKGNKVLVDSQSFNKGVPGKTQLKANGKSTDLIYRRRLVDYPVLLEQTGKHTVVLKQQIARVDENYKLAQQSGEDLAVQKSTRATQLDNLEKDSTNLQADLASIREQLKTLSEQLEQTQRRINDLYNDISEQHDAIKAKSQALLEKQTSRDD